ncbi:MAG TPA: rhodanese-like domain-containing protein [Tenericutes bacterium]|nr:rhodanese-like domain-containing protein [Mycoplasmatota bacterium]
MEEISISELILLKDRSKIIDIREKNEYKDHHLEGSINIPMNEILKNHYYYLNKEEKYYIICLSGIRSIKLCDELSKLGYKVINVKEGIKGLDEKIEN